MKDIKRTAIAMIILYVVLWYAGAMFNFLPFVGETAAVVGFTGLLIVIVIAVCTLCIVEAIQKKDK